ncbi:amidohydrolase family protein [Mediterraneibacter massiliensis]|uniref:amidohydrolase family protein n=1 Tax=Mediterraneibacter massiliensis TaxID=1720300 RepID=UPI0022E5393A|nr:amidohydrolase family protein [Mediterraneibacter massiliensis]
MEQYIVKAKNIIAGRKLQALQNAAVEVKDGKIEEIYESEAQIPEELKDKVTDLGDVTLMPGMIDCHNHLALDTRLENHLVKMNDCECEQTIRALKTMRDDLEAGVTTARCMGDRYYIDVTCKKAQQDGRIAGPKLVVSGIGMRASHGHGYVGMPFDGPEQFRKQARENIAHGVDFLKVFTTKVINATPFIYHFMSPEELKAVVQEAKSVGITTACHCSGGQGLEDCLEAGIDCLEHVYYITPEQVERVKKADKWVVYTPSYALNDTLLFKFSPQDREGSLKEKEIICRCLEGAISGGLKFGIGTDGIHTGLPQEAEYIASLGASNEQVLAGITVNAAKLCGVDDKTGAIEKGLAADFVVLAGNPLKDISALKQVRSVYQDGKKIR